MLGVRAASCDDERGGAEVVSTAHPGANARDKTNRDAADRMFLIRVIFWSNCPGTLSLLCRWCLRALFNNIPIDIGKECFNVFWALGRFVV